MRKQTILPAAVAVTTTAIVGGLASRPAQSPWYRVLCKPPYQPPRQAFPIVWPVLYADIALVTSATLDRLRDRGDTEQRRNYVAALSANLVLNAAWSWIFFDRRRLGTAAVPLALYPLWCAFATALSTHIWILNRA